MNEKLKLTIAIITISDRASQGVYEDKSGPSAQETLQAILSPHELSFRLKIIPDDITQITQELKDSALKNVDFIFTTGGTGIGPRDITPEATRQVIDTEIPGIAEAIRSFSLTKAPSAMLSRGIAGLSGQTIIINLPGSPKAVKEILEYLGSVLTHAVYMIQGEDVHLID